MTFRVYRIRDLIGLKVFDSNGKKVGVVCDLAIDYFNGKVMGFIITKKIYFQKEIMWT